MVDNEPTPKVLIKCYIEDFLSKFQLVANKVTSWSNTPTHTKYPSEKLVKDTLNNKADSNHTHYNIETTFGNEVFSEGKDYNGEGIGYGDAKLIYNSDETRFYYDKNGEYDEDPGNELVVMNDLKGTEKISNKVTGLSSSSTDTQYPSAKAVYDETDDIWNYIEGLDYTNIGGNLVDVDKGIQAIGLEQILTQIIAKINDNQHNHDDRYFTETEINDKFRWRTLSLTNMAGCTLYYNDYFCHFIINKSATLPTVNTATKLVTGTIPNGYRPVMNVTRWNDGASNANVRFRVDSGGSVYYITEKAFTSSATWRCVFTWARI